MTKKTVIFTGSAKTSGWGQAITLSTTKEGGSFDSSVIEKDGYFEVQFKGGTDKAEVILRVGQAVQTGREFHQLR